MQKFAPTGVNSYVTRAAPVRPKKHQITGSELLARHSLTNAKLVASRARDGQTKSGRSRVHETRAIECLSSGTKPVRFAEILSRHNQKRMIRQWLTKIAGGLGRQRVERRDLIARVFPAGHRRTLATAGGMTASGLRSVF
jgi:hypothetical protein